MSKAIINMSFGGFSVSHKGVLWMAERGHQGATEYIKGWSDQAEDWWYGNLEVPRHDPLLVEMVETLGREANGNSARLGVQEFKGDRYIIDEYDGYETLRTPELMDWENVND